MTKQQFREMAQDAYVLLDGATGSNLQKKGMPSGVCAEQWVTEHEEALMELQREYIEAGSQIVYAPTFGANRIKLKEYGLEEEAVSLNQRLVEISRQAVSDKAFIAGDVTMCGQQLAPLGSLQLETLIAAYEEQILALSQAGADLIVIETMMSLQETRAALIAARRVCELPVMVTMSFGEDGRTLYGTDVETAAVVLDGLGADAIGMNCSAGPDKMLPWIARIREVSNLPVIAKPNAGMPKLDADGATIYDMDADEFSEHMRLIALAGADILGGCCGTSPEYIRRIKELLPPKAQHKQLMHEKYITTERAIYKIADKPKLCMIDAKTDQALAEELSELEMDSIYDVIDELEDEDAICICIDGVPNQKEALRQIISEFSGCVSKPFCFSSEDKEILEYALVHYCGRSAVRSEKLQRDELEQLALRYGAYVFE